MVGSVATTSSVRGLVQAALLPPLLAQLKRGPLDGDDDPRLAADLLDELAVDADFPALAAALSELTSTSVPTPRFAAVWLPMADRLSTRAHHHLALLFERWGWRALNPPMAGAGARERLRAVRAYWTRSVTHFGQVLEDRAYFQRLASSAGAPELAETLHSRAAGLLLGPHGAALLSALSPDAPFEQWRVESHWGVLVAAPDSCETGGIASGMFEASGALWRRRAIERVMDHARTLADQADPLTSDVTALTAPFYHLTRFTNVAGMLEEISVWVVEKAVEWAWVLYKAQSSTTLESVLRATKPFGAHLEKLIFQTKAFGRQSLAADYLLFAADFADKDGGEERLIRRALKVCERHRNARLMLAHICLKKADVQLLRAGSLRGLWANREGSPLKRGEALIDEAEALHPENKRIAELRARAAVLRRG